MSRTSRWKLQYVGAVIALAVLLALVAWRLHLGPLAMLALVPLLLIPGRIHGMLFREQYRAVLLLHRDQHAAALEQLRILEHKLERRPALRGLWWLAWASYTRDALAMTLNNIGVACLGVGHFDEGERSFRSALELDPEYPIPHANLAAIEASRGNTPLAAEHASAARRLGLSGGLTDRLIRRSSLLLARVEGRP